MYAIIETGGKQYRVEKGDVIDVEKLTPAADGKVEFAQVLFLNPAPNGEETAVMKIGQPYVPHSVVIGKLLQEVKGEKVIAYKYKKRKRYHRKVGHRQQYARVQITEIIG